MSQLAMLLLTFLIAGCTGLQPEKINQASLSTGNEVLQATSPSIGLIDPSRVIDWTSAGIPGGIPVRTAICTTVNASTYSNGSVDATAGIQTALNNCPAGQIVQLSEGIFRINGSLNLKSGVTLRGAGPDKTKLDLRGSGPYAVRFGSEAYAKINNFTSVTGGATKDSTTITVSDSSNISVGGLLMISQQDLSYMTAQGSLGFCDWCDAGWPNNMNSGQIVEVTSVSGNTVTFQPALYINASNGPMAYPFTPGAKYTGLESLKISANDTGYTTVLFMSGTAYSWVKNVENDLADGDHFRIYWSFRNEVRDNFFHDGFNHGPGGTDNSLVLAHKSSANLIENNIFYRQHVSIMLEWGASGNVVAYNYSSGNYHQDQLTWLLGDFDFHGSHPMYNLFEGNIGVKFQPDSTWGSSSHSTVFRNWFSGSRQYVPPMNARGPLEFQNAIWEDANTFAYTIDYLSQYNNLIGNVAGSPHLLENGAINMRISTASGGGNPACYRIGYNSDDSSAMSPNNANATLLLHGNNDCVTNATLWNSQIVSQTLPASFFHSTKPSWFGSAPWPVAGPDVSGGIGPNGKAHKNPAQLCFDSSSRDGNGMPIFNASRCYAASPSPTPTPSPVPTPTPTPSPVPTPVPSQSYSVFTSQIPVELNVSDGVGVSYELGMKFTTSSAGQIRALKFYKSSNETGTHTGRIFSAGGVQLASVVFMNETPSGWQKQSLATPLNIVPGQIYVVTVNTGNAYYSATNNGLASTIQNGPLSTIVGANGVYGSVGAFPTNSYQASNYFRDVEFVVGDSPSPTPTPTPIDTIPPVTSITSPANGAAIPRKTSITIHAAASDNVGVVKVNIYVDGSLICTDVSSPYECAFQLSRVRGKQYQIQSKAYDQQGNQGVSSIVVITSN